MKHKLTVLHLVLSGIIFFCPNLKAQKDTVFWFVAPEITKGNFSYDNPTVFRISTYDDPGIVTISMPANPAFPIQTFSIPAGTSSVIDLTDYVEMVENKPPDQKLNKGILITSTSFISAYYEVIGLNQANPEIYALKGRNALGKEFYIPLQNIIENSAGYSPLPHAAFDIVATEDNTSITINPTRDLFGHSANVPFTIVLDRGETYNAEAKSQSASGHPTGSHVVADKPIAITIKDDLLESGLYFGGFCRDQMGDQIIPVEQTGRRYVVQKGLMTGEERAVIIGTKPGTTIKKNGTPVATINAGQATTINIDIGASFIEASEPVYVQQISGNGCEIAGEIIPSLDCSGSTSIRFVRTNSEDFVMFLITESGNQDAFTVNGVSGVIGPGFFQTVPGSGGAFVATAHYFPENEIIPGISTEVANSKGKFHLGFLNGAPSATGCRFGFFSDYQNKIKTIDTVYYCVGDTVTSHGIPIWSPGNYQAIISTGLPTDCDSLIEITAIPEGKIFNTYSYQICEGDSISVYGVQYSMPGIFFDTIPGTGGGCDTVITISVSLNNVIQSQKTLFFCPGTSIVYNGVSYAEPGVFQDTIPSGGVGCDTVYTVTLLWQNLVPQEQSLSFCPGSTILYNGILYSDPAVIVDTIQSLSNSCDTILTTQLVWESLPQMNIQAFICSGDTIRLGPVAYGAPGIFTDTLPGIEGCDTLRTIHIDWAALPVIERVVQICPGDSVLIGNQMYGAEGQVTDTLFYPEICDTIRLTSISFFQPSQYDVLPEQAIFCPGEPLRFESPHIYTVWNGSVTGPAYTVTETGTLRVFYKDENGCPGRDTVQIKSCCGPRTIYVPNTFAPEQKAPNNTFRAFSVEPCAVYTMRIYDRWGELLFFTDNPEKGWDGYFRGKICDTGVYVWVLEVAQEGQKNTEILSGDVTLLR